MNQSDMLLRVSKLEVMADLMKQEASTLRAELTAQPTPVKQRRNKMVAEIVAKRNARLIKAIK